MKRFNSERCCSSVKQQAGKLSSFLTFRIQDCPKIFDCGRTKAATQNAIKSTVFKATLHSALHIFLSARKVFRRVDVKGFHRGAERGIQYEVRVSVHYGSAADASI